ncbi:MAG: glycosyltransferase family 4 protein, partial [Flavobacterium sp.]|nr:glycosyltransferase family 4 protein [Flavobacterium sp.]
FEIKKNIRTTLNIISIGRTHWKKGYTYALDAMPFLQQQNSSFQYSLLGVRPSEELLFQLNDLNLYHHVVFKDAVPFEQVIQEIRNADVLLLPSVEEGIANVVLEAMALGTLVVTTACGGMTEVVTDGVNGFVVPVRNPKAIAAALMKVSELTLEDYQRMTKAARNTIEKNFTEQQMVEAMQKLYQPLETQA